MVECSYFVIHSNAICLQAATCYCGSTSYVTEASFSSGRFLLSQVMRLATFVISNSQVADCLPSSYPPRII